MAAEPFTTTRRTLLGAAAALPIAALPTSVIARTPDPIRGPRQSSRAQDIWNRRLATYRRLAARTKEAAETGFYRQALDRYDREVAAIERRFRGRTARLPSAHPEQASSEVEMRVEGRLIRAAFERVDAVEGAFYDRCTAPMQRAAVRLANTPTPNLEALLAKIRVMHEQEVDELGSMARPVLEVLAEDVELLISA
jgi:hypothetical protein